MFEEEYGLISDIACKKLSLLKKNPAGYFVLSMLAGIYVGFGVLLSYTIGGMLNGEPYAKVIMGASFAVALSLVTIAGAELFTGNNLVMTAGIKEKKIKFIDAYKILIICYIGNLAGSILLAVIFNVANLNTGAVANIIAKTAEYKMNITFVPLLMRGLLCNILVCLAVWCGYKCKSESGKLIMIFWCIFAFIITGFEHSIANMTILSVAMINPLGYTLSIGGYIYNLSVVTLGNMIGGILFVALPYYIASRKK